MEDRIKKVMAAVFQLAEENIDEDASPDTIASWDSLRHMSLVLALEEEFDVKFEDDEILDMRSYKLILLITEEKIT